MKSISKLSIESILEEYSIGNLISFSYLKRGIENLNIKIQTTKGVYVLRIHRETKGFRTKEYVGFEIELLNALSASRLKVPRPIQKRDGKYLFDIKDAHGVIFSFIKGKHLYPNASWKVEQVGLFMGEMHKRTHNLNIIGNGARKSIDPKNVKKLLDKNIKGFTQASPKHGTILSSFENQLPLSLLPELPQGVVHADMHDEGVFFEKGKLSGVVDWDDAYSGPLIMDLAVVIFVWCWDKKTMHWSWIKRTVEQYEKSRKLSNVEFLWLRRVCLIAAYWHAAYMSQPQFRNKKKIRSHIGHLTSFIQKIAPLSDEEFIKKIQ